MRHELSGATAGPGRSKSWTFLLAAVLAAGFTLPGRVAAVGTGVNSGGNPGLGDGGGDDETIGTLPIQGSQGQIPLFRHLRDSRPSFYLEGNYDDILSTLAGFTGTGAATVETLPNGMSRLGFHGKLEVQLDRGLLQATGIQIGEHVPATFRGAAAWGGMEGQLDALGRLRAGDLMLPVATLDSVDMLSGVPWIFAAHTRTHGDYQFHAWSEGSILYVGQTY